MRRWWMLMALWLSELVAVVEVVVPVEQAANTIAITANSPS